jgi:2-polyprenyl-3-methyl-5-hydroxy-6-metoxy-1,4-benzoquinol methylase
MEAYEGNERDYWERRIQDTDRYASVGINSLPNSINKHRKEQLFHILRKVLDQNNIDLENSSVLDAGCGTGIYSEWYASRGANVSGVDISENAIESIRDSALPGEYYPSSLHNLPFDDEKFDIIHVFSVLYHIIDDRDWKRSLEEIDRCTKPGGHLLMRVEWVDNDKHINDHVKHRSKYKYMNVFMNKKAYSIKGIYEFDDVIEFKKLFIGINKFLPDLISESTGSVVESLNLLKENESQRVVVFEKN